MLFNMLYCVGKNHTVLEFGHSYYGSHNLLVSLHAEEAAINSIYKKWINLYNIRDLSILIWKQSKNGAIKPVYCCDWCRKYITKNNINPNSVITFTQTICDISNSVITDNITDNNINMTDNNMNKNTNDNILRPTITNIQPSILFKNDYFISALSIAHHMPTLFKKSIRSINRRNKNSNL